MDSFFEHLEEEGYEVTDPFDGSGNKPVCVNTYNDECLLDQTLQFYAGTVNGQSLVLLQVHGGCDVRGGYTAPKCFIENRYNEYAMFDYGRGHIDCSECDANWMLEGGHTLFDGGTRGPKLEPVVEHGDEHEGAVIERPIKGLVYVDEQGVGHCPVCGEGRLHGSF